MKYDEATHPSTSNQILASPINRNMDPDEREILAEIYIGLLKSGRVKHIGKTQEQLYLDLVRQAMEWSQERPIKLSLDFRAGLLKQARDLKRRDQLNEAAVYYATWFEHWINGFFNCKSVELEEGEFRQMIRDVNIRGKFTWLLCLVAGCRIPERHSRAILRVCELRNEFVHYKFKSVDPDDWKHELNNSRQVLKSAESAVRYLQDFETRYFFKGAARQLLKSLRYTKTERNGTLKRRARKKKPF